MSYFKTLRTPLLVAALLLFCGYFVYSQWDELLKLRIEHPLFLVPLLCSAALVHFVQAGYNVVAFPEFSIPVTWADSLFLSVQNYIGNLVGPFRAGTVANAVSLKKRWGVGYALFSLILLGLYVISFGVNAGVGALLVACETGLQGQVERLTFGALLLTCVGAGVFFALPIRLLGPLLSFPFLGRVAEGVDRLKHSRRLLRGFVMLTLLNVLLVSANIYFSLKALGAEVNYVKTIFVSVFSVFSLLVSFTPGSLGVREAFAAFSGSIVGLEMHQVIAASLLERVLSLLLGILIYSVISKKLSVPSGDRIN